MSLTSDKLFVCPHQGCPVRGRTKHEHCRVCRDDIAPWEADPGENIHYCCEALEKIPLPSFIWGDPPRPCDDFDDQTAVDIVPPEERFMSVTEDKTPIVDEHGIPYLM